MLSTTNEPVLKLNTNTLSNKNNKIYENWKGSNFFFCYGKIYAG